MKLTLKQEYTKFSLQKDEALQYASVI